MSLQVWLPLTKDLRNQGLSDVVVINNGATYSSTNGKVGGCYTFDGNDYIQSINNLNITGDASYSIAFWFYWDADSWTNNFAGVAGFGTMSTSQGAFACLHNGYPDIDYWNGRYKATNQLSVKTWYHLCFTKASGTNGNAHIYVNGVEVSGAVSSSSIAPNIVAGKVIIGRLNDTSERYFKGRLNDVRIYDHCLTENEVKRLAQGLFLHYKLDNNGWGGENLFAYGSDCQTELNMTQSTNKFTIITEDGIKCAHAAGALTTEKRLQSKVGITPAPQETFTFSAWVKLKNIAAGTTNPMCEFYFSGQTIDGAWRGVDYVDFKVDGKSVSLSSIHFYTGGWNINDSNWHYVSATCKYKNVTYTGTLYPAIYLRDCTGDLYVHHIKFERGNKATPWCPAAGDDLYNAMGLDNLIEYDISGFGYNGTHVGSLDWSSDSPKYSASTNFNGSSYIKTLPGELKWSNYEQLTIAAWMKPTTTPTNWIGSIGIAHDNNYTNKLFSISNYGGKFTVHTVTGSGYTSTQSTYTCPLNEWHHYVATLNDTTVNMYVDGVLNKTFTINWGTATNHASPQIQVGVDLPGSDEIYTGYYSDVRIYATALSADDVESLYQNSAYIDSNGIIHGAIH